MLLQIQNALIIASSLSFDHGTLNVLQKIYLCVGDLCKTVLLFACPHTLLLFASIEA